MAPQIDPERLESLKHRATERAEHLGHRLGPFQTAKHDPFCYVSFCRDCRQIVIVSLEQQNDDHAGALYGYALEAACAAQDATREPMLVSADAH